MRLVADTNVVISALLWGGLPKTVFALRETINIEFYTSRVLLDELADVLSRKRLAKTISAIDASPASLLRYYQGFARVVQPRSVPRVVRDPDDDHVIAAAITANADMIVSGDKDLHALGREYRGTVISTPAQAVRMLSNRR